MTVPKFVLCLCLLGHGASAFLASPKYDIRLSAYRQQQRVHTLPLKSAVTNETEMSQQREPALGDDTLAAGISFASTATVAIPPAIVDDSAVVDCEVAAGVPPVASLTSTTTSSSLLQLAVAGALATIVSDVTM